MSTDLSELGGLLEPDFLALDDFPLRTSTIFSYLGTSICLSKSTQINYCILESVGQESVGQKSVGQTETLMDEGDY